MKTAIPTFSERFDDSSWYCAWQVDQLLRVDQMDWVLDRRRRRCEVGLLPKRATPKFAKCLFMAVCQNLNTNQRAATQKQTNRN